MVKKYIIGIIISYAVVMTYIHLTADYTMTDQQAREYCQWVTP